MEGLLSTGPTPSSLLDGSIQLGTGQGQFVSMSVSVFYWVSVLTQKCTNLSVCRYSICHYVSMSVCRCVNIMVC